MTQRSAGVEENSNNEFSAHSEDSARVVVDKLIIDRKERYLGIGLVDSSIIPSTDLRVCR